MTGERERLFTPRFFVMCAFSFTVFLSAFQLLPTAPFRILALGGSKFAAGMFLGFLTYASAFSAPLTGALADRIGKRRMLIVCSLVIAGFSVAYALSRSYRVPLALAFAHGIFWSGLLSASAAYITDIVPESRRAEGIGYWGLSTIVAIAVAPTIGFWVYGHGWTWLCVTTGALNVLMAAIAFLLPEPHAPAWMGGESFFTRRLLEWRVLVVSFTLFLYSFGYGGITSFSALYADANHVVPKGIYFTVLALAILMTRPLCVPLGDRLGHKKLFLPSLILIVVGLTLLALGGTRPWLVASAVGEDVARPETGDRDVEAGEVRQPAAEDHDVGVEDVHDRCQRARHPVLVPAQRRLGGHVAGGGADRDPRGVEGLPRGALVVAREARAGQVRLDAP